MGCEVDYMWSLSSLVAAFLDLAISYFLLCASSVVFLGTKFLGLFGLPLPCPCNGLFGISPNTNLCLKRLLVDFPNEKVSDVQLLVRGKFPFNIHNNCHLNMRLIEEKDDNCFNTSPGLVGIEPREASCSSLSDARKSISVPRIEFETNKTEIGSVRGGRADVKGKGVTIYKNRSGIRRRRKRALAAERWTSSSVSSYDHSLSDFQSCPISPPSINKERNEIRLWRENSRELYGNGFDAHYSHYRETHKGTRHGQRDGFDLNGFPDYDEQNEKIVSSNDREEEEEQAGRDALYLELEKERNAAATAADEAMSMIARLQEEKALIEMEARQYQRIYEEKSAYDAEEMNILKEILVRREREKLFLEKEVEAYRKMMVSVGNEQPAAGDDEHIPDTERQLSDYSLYESEDPILMLRQLSASIDKKTMKKSKRSDESGMESSALGQKEDSSFLEQGSHPFGYQEFQEKEMVTMIDASDGIPLPCSKTGVSEHNHPENTSHDDSYQDFSASNLSFDKELHVVHDVHIIDGSNVSNEGKGSEGMPLSTNDDLTCSIISSLPPEGSASQAIDADRSTSFTNTQMEEAKSRRSSSGVFDQLPPLDPKTISIKPGDVLRRHSLSTFDIERLKIDYEVERLRERLKSVQEGREKLNLSVENREGEKVQLKLLEDIAQQLREIRHLTQPEKEIRQASLPPPSSKVKPKKKRCRSASLGVHNSS
ncbi:hypothetical protein DM860_003325 [Cuscuta australis]|uniref:GTD-binding domain-containing protein n=1 Tax=Cuscuta australis TaxID=267555 RepID=A0A328DGD1_9ASTE|nr:hypothetical protein DM860_003325 [Cuscuta australis]